MAQTVGTTRDIQGIDRFAIEAATGENTVYNGEFLMIEAGTDEVISLTTANGIQVGWCSEETTSDATEQGVALTIPEPKWIMHTVTGDTPTKIGYPVYATSNSPEEMTLTSGDGHKLVGALMPYSGTTNYAIDIGFAARAGGELHGFNKEQIKLGQVPATDLDTPFAGVGPDFVPGGACIIKAFGFKTLEAVADTDVSLVLSLYSGTTQTATAETITVLGTACSAAGDYVTKTLTTPIIVHDGETINIGALSTATIATAGQVDLFIEIEHALGS